MLLPKLAPKRLLNSWLANYAEEESMRIILFTVLTAVACLRVAIAQEMEPLMNVADDTALANAEVVFAMFDAFDSGDTAAAAAFVAEDASATIYGPPEGAPFYGTFNGRAEVQEMLGLQLEFFQDEQFELKEIVAAGDRVVLIARQQGRFPNGNSYDNNFILVLTVREGSITSLRAWEDSAQVVAGLQ